MSAKAGSIAVFFAGYYLLGVLWILDFKPLSEISGLGKWFILLTPLSGCIGFCLGMLFEDEQ